MNLNNWKLILSLLIAALVIIIAAIRFTRRVPAYDLALDRQISPWGSVDADTARELQAILDQGVNRLKVPGLQAYIRTPEGQTWSGTSGTTDLAREQPLEQDNLLRIGSVTKTFTAAIVLKLVEAGLLDLEDPLAKWLPQLPEAETITIRNLLNHTSGIVEIIPKGMLKSIIPTTYWGLDELVNLIASEKPKFAPGSQFDYSNSNYILLGIIAEKISGKTMLQLLHEEIIDPLKLEHTCFIPYEPAPDRLVAGFDRDLSSFPGMLDISPDNTSWATLAFTSGAMASTAEDLGIFFEHLMHADMLAPATLKEMTTFIDAPNPGFPQQNGYGLGLMRLDVNGHELIGHVGQFMGATTIAMLSPDEGYIIVITCNLSNPELVAVLADLQEIIQPSDKPTS